MFERLGTPRGLKSRLCVLPGERVVAWGSGLRTTGTDVAYAVATNRADEARLLTTCSPASATRAAGTPSTTPAALLILEQLERTLERAYATFIAACLSTWTDGKCARFASAASTITAKQESAPYS